MGDSKTTEMDEGMSFHDKHRFFIFITTSILIASFLVVISMALYNNSGAAQLDLSRPGYKSVRSQAVTNDGNFETFSSSGSIDQTVINEFKAAYKAQADKAKAVDAFSGDPLSPDALGISSTSVITTTPSE